MNIKSYIKQNKLTLAQFAETVGISEHAVRKYVYKQRRPEWDILQRIVNTTNGEVTANDFLPDPPDHDQGEAA